MAIQIFWYIKLMSKKTLKEQIAAGKDYYFNQWRGHEKICPAFGEKVYITEVGWNHIAKHPRRVLVDKLIRIRKLPLAREVLETTNSIQTLRKKGKYWQWGIQAIKGNTRVKIVISSRNKTGTKKILFSVMFKNINRSKQKAIQEHNQRIIREFRKKYPRRLRK